MNLLRRLGMVMMFVLPLACIALVVILIGSQPSDRRLKQSRPEPAQYQYQPQSFN